MGTQNKIQNFLITEFEKRRSRNAQYSLRAYARFLKIDAPNLSKILKGKITPGKNLSSRLVERIGVPEEVKVRLLDDDSTYQKLRASKDDEFLELGSDYFTMLSHWYYYALLELLELKDLKHDKNVIANKLGLTKFEVTIALARMERLGILKKINNHWVEVSNKKMTSIGKINTSPAHRNHQREILEKAIYALEDTPEPLRSHSSMTCAINTLDIPKVKELIKEFRRKISKYLNNADKKDAVYNLAISFYPVTKEVK